MSEPGFSDYIALNYAMTVCIARALIDAGMLSAADLASAYRTAAESLPNELVVSELRTLAEILEEAGAECLLAPSWTPKVVPGGKDDGDGGA